MIRKSVVIAEGFLFTAKLIGPLLLSVHQAIWMFPTQDFRRDSFNRRGKDQYHYRNGNNDPILASRNHFDHDRVMAAQMRKDTEIRGLTFLDVDGSNSPDEIAIFVEEHFAPYLESITHSSS